LKANTNIPAIEQEIVMHLQNNNPKALELIYDHYAPALYGVILKIHPNEFLAQDILQQSIVKMWQNSTSFDASKGRLFTWLLNISRNTALDKLKSKEIKNATANYDTENIVYLSDSQQNLTPNTDTIGLSGLVNELSNEHKLLIDLMYYKGYTQAEIATELNMPHR
jgi:RNA polymerase sigma-70 factor (ECF subfamily)